MTGPVEAFPLTWPPNRPRTRQPENFRFKVTLSAAIKPVQDEVYLLGARELTISSNLPVRRDASPIENRGQSGDRGVAVYFTYKKKPMCFACDRWLGAEETMRAIAKTIDALRGIERWGSGQMVEQAFTGFLALPAPEQPWQVLELDTSRSTRDQIDAAHRWLAAKHHPDRGGNADETGRINAARDELYWRLEQ